MDKLSIILHLVEISSKKWGIYPKKRKKLPAKKYFHFYR